MGSDKLYQAYPLKMLSIASNILQTISLSSLDSFSARQFNGELITNSFSSVSFIIANVYSAWLSHIPLCKLLNLRRNLLQSDNGPCWHLL